MFPTLSRILCKYTKSHLAGSSCIWQSLRHERDPMSRMLAVPSEEKPQLILKVTAASPLSKWNFATILRSLLTHMWRFEIAWKSTRTFEQQNLQHTNHWNLSTKSSPFCGKDSISQTIHITLSIFEKYGMLMHVDTFWPHKGIPYPFSSNLAKPCLWARNASVASLQIPQIWDVSCCIIHSDSSFWSHKAFSYHGAYFCCVSVSLVAYKTTSHFSGTMNPLAWINP